MIPLFVGGTGRSGTTVCLEYLGSHSKIYASNPIEIRVLTEKHGLLDLFETKNISTFNTYFEKTWKYGTNKTIGLQNFIDIEELFDDLKKINANITEETIKNFYFNLIIKQKGFKQGSLYIGDSTPSNIRYSHRITQIMPDSKFIHMFRDGRDSAYSIYKMRDYFSVEGSKNEFDCLDWWYDRITQSFESLNQINKEQYINVRLEDFVEKQSIFEQGKILKFLNINNEERLKKYFAKNINKNSMSIGEWKKLNSWEEFDKAYSNILVKLNKKNINIEKYY